MPQLFSDDEKIILEKVDKLENHFKVYKSDMEDVKDAIKDLKTAIIGNEINGRKGFINVLDILEKKVDDLNNKHILLEDNMKNIKFVSRGFITAFIGYLFWLVSNK